MVCQFKRKISLDGTRYLLIDFTQPLSESTEVYPGDPRLVKHVFSTIQKSGYQHHVYMLGDHNFHPHGDAPNHQNADLPNSGFESFGIQFCFNHACLIDLSCSDDSEMFSGVKYLVEVTEEHLKPWSDTIRGKGAVLIRTGYDRLLEANKPHIPKKIPYLSKRAADFVSKFKGLKVIGTDSLTVDPIGGHYAHKKFKNLLIVESMVHLYLVPKAKQEGFFLQTSPVRIVGATGGPVIAYAFVKA